MKRIFETVRNKWLAKSSIDRLNADDLRRKNILLKNEERRLYTEIEGTEKAKDQLFDQARSKDVSDRQRMQAARKIEGLDNRLKDLDRRLTRNSKEQRMVEGILRMKEQTSEQNAGSVLQDVDPNELREWIEAELVAQQIADEKAAQILGLFEQDSSYEVYPAVSEAQQAIYEQICKASEAHGEAVGAETEIARDIENASAANRSVSVDDRMEDDWQIPQNEPATRI
jgi:hypothetical protein